LRVFVAVAEYLSFTRAGEALGVTPGAASLQIRALEEYLSRPLFRRNGRVVHLTTEGAALLPRVRQALGDLEHALAVAQRQMHDAEVGAGLGVELVLELDALSDAKRPRNGEHRRLRARARALGVEV
jgi:DNA-binding transcriptional LysR family regulator